MDMRSDARHEGTSFAQLDQVLAGYVESGQVPCVVAALGFLENGEHFFVAGTRDISSGDPVQRDTIFCIYSVSKIMTACAVMQLVEQGKVGLDDPVEKYLPELAPYRVWVGQGAAPAATVPAKSSPTIRQLLTHTAGYYYDRTADAPLGKLMENPDARLFLKAEEFLEFIAGLPLHNHPGEIYRYSISYALLGLVVERSSGKSLEDYMQECLFRPLRMNDTGFVIPAEKMNRVARICRRDSEGKLFIDPASEARVPARGSFFAGGGDLFSTADDLLKFGRMLLNKGELDGVRVLQKSTVEEMTRDQLGDVVFPSVDYMARDALGFGVGLATKDSPGGVGFAGAYGWTGNATTLLQIDPRAGVVAVVLSQVRPGNQDFYRDFLRESYLGLPYLRR